MAIIAFDSEWIAILLPIIIPIATTIFAFLKKSDIMGIDIITLKHDITELKTEVNQLQKRMDSIKK